MHAIIVSIIFCTHRFHTTAVMGPPGKIVERPQHLLMRAACGIHAGNLEAVLETYDLMSRKYFTHASPTLFNAGTPNPQMSSCFLLKMQEDSIDGIYDTLRLRLVFCMSLSLLPIVKLRTSNQGLDTPSLEQIDPEDYTFNVLFLLLLLLELLL